MRSIEMSILSVIGRQPMKTIATAAVFLTLTASAWANEPESGQPNDLAISNEPIVLSEVQMDGVTAGTGIDSDIVGLIEIENNATRQSSNFWGVHVDEWDVQSTTIRPLKHLKDSIN